MDFTLKLYRILLKTLKNQGFLFFTFEGVIENSPVSYLILRHDVDRLPENSLQFAEIQAEMGIKGTYYFRAVKDSFNPVIIQKISNLGHEIGYHYEDMAIAGRNINFQRADRMTIEKYVADLAIESFSNNLKRIRSLAPVSTICMHGSPMSRWDSRLIWKYYNYRDFGIRGEAYLDTNFDNTFYLTDTGRRWDGERVNIRDKASFPVQVDQEIQKEGKDTWPTQWNQLNFIHSTRDIITAAESSSLPEKVMITFHPQRWTDNTIPWLKELFWQNAKNTVKYFVIKIGNKR